MFRGVDLTVNRQPTNSTAGIYSANLFSQRAEELISKSLCFCTYLYIPRYIPWYVPRYILRYTYTEVYTAIYIYRSIYCDIYISQYIPPRDKFIEQFTVNH